MLGFFLYGSLAVALFTGAIFILPSATSYPVPAELDTGIDYFVALLSTVDLFVPIAAVVYATFTWFTWLGIVWLWKVTLKAINIVMSGKSSS